MSKLKHTYININSDFKLIWQKAVNNSGVFFELINILKKNNLIIHDENKKTNQFRIKIGSKDEIWLLLNVTFSGQKNKLNRFRVQFPGQTIDKKHHVDRILMIHRKTGIFLLSLSNQLITDSKSISSFWIDFWWFFYFKSYGPFIHNFSSNKRNSQILICDSGTKIFNFFSKERENLNENERKRKKIIENTKILLSDFKKNVSKNQIFIKDEKEKIISEFKKIEQLEKLNVIKIDSKFKKYFKKQRVGHEKWRKRICQEYDYECPITLIQCREILTASHVKPWASCELNESVDIENGILLSPLLNKLFDIGLITFQNNGKITYSQRIPKKLVMKISDQIQNSDYPSIIIKKVNSKYLKWHQKNVFKKK